MGDAKLLVNCHVFDGVHDGVRRDQYILVRDGEITQTGPGSSGRRPRPAT